MLHATIEDRVTGKPLFLAGARLVAERLRWQAQGGPLDGLLRLEGAGTDPAGLAQLLRCPARVVDQRGAAAWWGFVEAVEIDSSAGRLSLDLSAMANRVAVRYRDEAPGPGLSGWQWQTDWAEDAASARRYGRKERILTLAQGRPEEAEALRDATLARLAWPTWKTKRATLSLGGRVSLRVRGWWHSLDWVYYAREEGWQGALGGGAGQALGTPTAARCAQAWTANGDWPLKDIWIKAARVGSPADDLLVELYGQIAPTEVLLAACAAIPASALTGEPGWVKCSLPAPFPLSGGTTYWVMARRSAAVDPANSYRLTVDEGRVAAGSFWVWNGSAWVARSPDAGLVYSLTGEEETSQQLRVLVEQAGQFLNGCRVKDPSGVMGRQYRAGSRRASHEAAELLDMGATGGAGLLARVSPERVVVIEKMPLPASVDWVLDGAGRLRWREGRRGAAGEGAVGRFARLEGLDSALGRVWIQSAEWTETGGLRVWPGADLR